MSFISCGVLGVFMAITERGGAPTVVVETADDKCVLIYVGLFEALSISHALKGEILPRPITHDLFIDLLEKFSISVLSLHIDSLDGGVFYSKLTCTGDHEKQTIDCRPSDGIAIALRADAPILIDKEVVDCAGVARDELGDLKDIANFM
ncbi:MAG TPA: bifunctional nuclease family protein [Methanoculleus sp.]|nr:bifunctional nuclease family protein [Methanoculleus sp.]